MSVSEFLEIADENSNCYILDTDSKVLSVYDGRNSIDSKFNNSIIKKIYSENNAFMIVIDE